jgi:hypothetical protein
MKYLYTNINQQNRSVTYKDWPKINLEKFKEWNIEKDNWIIIEQKILRNIKWKIWYQEILFDWYILSSVIDVYTLK